MCRHPAFIVLYDRYYYCSLYYWVMKRTNIEKKKKNLQSHCVNIHWPWMTENLHQSLLNQKERLVAELLLSSVKLQSHCEKKARKIVWPPQRCSDPIMRVNSIKKLFFWPQIQKLQLYHKTKSSVRDYMRLYNYFCGCLNYHKAY